MYILLRNSNRYCYIQITRKITYNVFNQGYSIARRAATCRDTFCYPFQVGFNCISPFALFKHQANATRVVCVWPHTYAGAEERSRRAAGVCYSVCVHAMEARVHTITRKSTYLGIYQPRRGESERLSVLSIYSSAYRLTLAPSTSMNGPLGDEGLLGGPL